MQSKVRKNTPHDGQMGMKGEDAVTDWFAEWFDTGWYDEMYASRDDREAKALVDWIGRVVPPGEAPRVLDLGCGRGRHAIALSALGYEVTGLDLSDRALKLARARAAAEGCDIRFVKGDMREALPERFDMVVSLFTSFGYFERPEDDLLVLDAVASMVAPGGWFVMDFLNPGYVASNLVAAERKQLRTATVRIDRRIESGEPFPLVVKKMTFTGLSEGTEETEGTRGSEGVSRTFEERVRLYPSRWFAEALGARGLVREKVLGGYAGEPYEEERSRRMVQVFRRVE